MRWGAFCIDILGYRGDTFRILSVTPVETCSQVGSMYHKCQFTTVNGNENHKPEGCTPIQIIYRYIQEQNGPILTRCYHFIAVYAEKVDDENI